MKVSLKKIILFPLALILLIGGVFLYNNFNRLLSEALMRNFNSNIISNVYELSFEKLSVNPFEGSIRVSNVTIKPREKPAHDYPYVNSSFRLTTEKLVLLNVQIFDLLKSNKLILERISIVKPDIELTINGYNPILFPFKDSTRTMTQTKETSPNFPDAFSLSEFQLRDASIHVTNSSKQREFTVTEFNISLLDLLLKRHERSDELSFKQAYLSVANFKGTLKKEAIRQVAFNALTIGIDSLNIRLTPDTVMYSFQDYHTGLKSLDVQSTDSIFHTTVKSFDLSYRDEEINMTELSFKPNVSLMDLQKDYVYQHADFSGSVGTVNLRHVNFDSLIYGKKIFIDEIVLDQVTVSIFKDKTKPIDKNRIPNYLGQVVKGITLPVQINKLKATNVNLANVERKPDSTYAKVNIQQGTVEVQTITNRSSDKMLIMKANAYIENKAHFTLQLNFNYMKPEFTFDGNVKKFDLAEINPLIESYTPAKVNAGTVDEMLFSGVAKETAATGTMKFLYHDLNVDLKLNKMAKWKSSVISFAANTVLNFNNPVSADSPPRVVQFNVERDMNKGFINIILKSVLNGLKETIIMSKENRRTHQVTKKKLHKDQQKIE